MKKFNRLSYYALVLFLGISIGFLSCQKEEIANRIYEQEIAIPKATSLTENFETGTKTAYAGASVVLSTGSW